ncbi:hypothetical protein [Paludibaculum fermentans]|uniref:hypothetical protein n=1 Tax=Paludibaculum fermentans TaxID=1473598 RepID=UPI003EBBE23F
MKVFSWALPNVRMNEGGTSIVLFSAFAENSEQAIQQMMKYFTDLEATGWPSENTTQIREWLGTTTPTINEATGDVWFTNIGLNVEAWQIPRTIHAARAMGGFQF